MKHTVTLTPDEVKEAVREYLENRGYICGCGGARELARVDFAYSSTEGPNFVACVVEGARPAGSQHEDEYEDQSELNR